jgi:hypothetical protein
LTCEIFGSYNKSVSCTKMNSHFFILMPSYIIIFVSMMSTQCTAEKTMFHEEKFIDRSPRDFNPVGGIKPNIQCGKKTEVKEKQFKESSVKLHEKMKKDSFTETKVFLKSSNSKSSRNKRSFDEVESTNLLRSFEKGINDGGRWEYGLEEKYNEDQIDSIMGMLSYMVNVYNGFGRSNDESLYKDERESDVTGALYQEARNGFEISKRNSDFQNEIERKKIRFTLK